LITSIWLIRGLQLIAVGLIGEYIGKIYIEAKRRPKYIVDINTYQLPQAHLQLTESNESRDRSFHLDLLNYPETKR
jgi:hypothetical protein